jgi:transcriptional regulator with XRE-family HTH domain
VTRDSQNRPVRRHYQRGLLNGLRTWIWDRDGRICGICGEAILFEQLELDHIVERARGGSDSLANLRATHHACNQARNRHLIVRVNIESILRKRRQDLELTQRELAIRAGVSPTTIQRFELHRKRLQSATLSKIAAVLGLETSELTADARPNYEVTCASCGEIFRPYRNDAKTCSVRCRQKRHRARSAQAGKC